MISWSLAQAAIAGMHSLGAISLSSCSFTEPWPRNWSQLPISTMWVDHNQFKGELIGPQIHRDIPCDTLFNARLDMTGFDDEVFGIC